MLSELYKEHLYYNPNYTYLINQFITEYDIRKANINVLFAKKIITAEEYGKLFVADREYRQIWIGNLLKRKQGASEILKRGIIEAKEKLFKANNIQDADVLCIKNDAVFIVNRQLSKTVFDNIEFVKKNMYTSYYRIKVDTLKELFYYCNIINDTEYLHVKGMKDDVLKLHDNYFLDFLKTLFCAAQTEPITDVLDILSAYYTKYLNLELDINCYRRFDSESQFDLKQMSYVSSYRTDYVTENDKKNISIQYKQRFINELNKIYGNIYFANMKR